MADPISNFIQTYMQQQQLQIARQNAATQATAAANQGQVDAATVMDGFMKALSHTNKENRQPIVDAFAKSTGADPALLSRVADTIQDSPELLRQQAANEAVRSGTFSAPQLAAPVLTGQSFGQSAEDKHLADFITSRGTSLGMPGQQLYHEFNAKLFAGMNKGQVAQSGATADLDKPVLQRMATNAGGVTQTAQEIATLPIQQTQAQAALMGGQASLANAATGAQRTSNDYTLGLGNLDQQGKDFLVNAAIKLATAKASGLQVQQDAIKNLLSVNQQLGKPMPAENAAMLQAIAGRALGLSGFPQFNLQNTSGLQSFFGARAGK